MRLLIAGLSAVAAFSFAAPCFAQTEEPTTGAPSSAPAASAPAPVPSTKPKPGTAAYCQTLKSGTSRNNCQKKVQAQASAKSTSSSKKAKKPSTTTPTTP